MRVVSRQLIPVDNELGGDSDESATHKKAFNVFQNIQITSLQFVTNSGSNHSTISFRSSFHFHLHFFKLHQIRHATTNLPEPRARYGGCCAWQLWPTAKWLLFAQRYP